jgi:ABC-type dipeptide/oligopeptide/nickel transport system permease component
MGRYVVSRLLWLVLVVFVVSLLTFGFAQAVPGGPFTREKALPEVVLKNLERKYNLDAPVWKQYVDYMADIVVPRVTRGEMRESLLDNYLINIPLGSDYTLRWMDFGPSYASRSRTVNDIFRENLPISFELGLYALGVALVIGLPFGILAALKQNSLWDYSAMGIAVLGVSAPVIVLGPFLIWIFAVELGWFLPTGWLTWQHKILPSVALGTGSSAIIARLTRASLLQVVREDYIRTARAKGLNERVVVIRHALKNSLIPITTVLGPLMAAWLTGSFLVEWVFSIGGIGKFFVSSVTNRDYTLIMGTIMVYSIALVMFNLLVDIAYGFIDPRIRFD